MSAHIYPDDQLGQGGTMKMPFSLETAETMRRIAESNTPQVVQDRAVSEMRAQVRLSVFQSIRVAAENGKTEVDTYMPIGADDPGFPFMLIGVDDPSSMSPQWNKKDEDVVVTEIMEDLLLAGYKVARKQNLLHVSWANA